MKKESGTRTAIYFIVIIVLVVGLSLLSARMWGGKGEQAFEPKALLLEEGMTVGSFGQANGLPNRTLKEIFGLQTRSDLEKQLEAYGTIDQVRALVTRKLALASEHASKNWIKIPVKFGLWFVFLTAVFFLLKTHEATPGIRKWLLFGSVLIFGVAMGSDPGPMGTVKDAIHLYGTAHAIFPPRMIALTVFLIIVFLANKYICAWGCQAGTLQDLMFRINQTRTHKAIIGGRIKLPFVLTNTVRVAFFGVFTMVVFLWGMDIIAPIDPFKIFSPSRLGIIGGLFIAILLLASLFIYRPWCHLFCPFGLVGWFVEKVSRVRISVDYQTCIACEKCAAACPSTVMEAILKGDTKTIPDCFACYTCRDVCPTDSICFSTRKRALPPPDHFKKNK